MKSVIIFDEQQQKDFRFICSDFGGPTSTLYVLEVVERILVEVGAFSSGDTVRFDDKELNDEVDVLLAALEFYRAKQIAESK